MKNSDINNIYKLDGKVPVSKAIPFGLQHILAMFVANIAPIIIVSSACGLDTTETARLIQTAMIVAGIGSNSVVSYMESRFGIADCNGNKFYVCICVLFCRSYIRIRSHCRSGYYRRNY